MTWLELALLAALILAWVNAREWKARSRKWSQVAVQFAFAIDELSHQIRELKKPPEETL